MAKTILSSRYDIGEEVTPISPNVKKDELYLDTVKAQALEADMITQLKTVQTSLTNINKNLKKAVSQGMVKGSYATSFKKWAKKSSSQAKNADKSAQDLQEKFDADVKEYTIKILSEKVAALEAKINQMGI